MKKVMSDNENNIEEADDNYEGEDNGDEKVMMMVMVMITTKNMMTVIKKVTVKRLMVVMEVMTMKQY